MKKLLIGLLAMGNFSAFAHNSDIAKRCKIKVSTFINKVPDNVRNELEKKGYSLSKNYSFKDSELYLEEYGASYRSLLARLVGDTENNKLFINYALEEIHYVTPSLVDEALYSNEEVIKSTIINSKVSGKLSLAEREKMGEKASKNFSKSIRKNISDDCFNLRAHSRKINMP